ncbi:glycosyltransferase [Paraburkholderia pallida]|uniref:Glycosyltransferase n=1 Tax=Paraburkholderia pallida TaxID=2547399 RepID=A0A4P7CRW4_9BURK|nr:glycosyltransferase [Paraburkholderia pallida]QBQ96699.1 glycosyltransferase [Paraburkholderia pallida]
MRIALVSTTFTIGGAEKQVRDLAAMFAREGHEVLIVSCKGPTEQDVPEGVDLVELQGKKSVLGLLSVELGLVRVLRAWRPDVVHGHMVVANILSRFASIFIPRVIVVSTAHSIDEGGGRIRLCAYRLTDWLADLTTNVSRYAVDHYIRVKACRANKIRLANNGIDFERFTYSSAQRNYLRNEFGLTAATPVCLAVGRLVEAKDYPNLLRAFSSVVQAIPAAQLFIVGDGPLAASLRSLVDELDLSRSARLLGKRTDIPELMSCADLFVLSSSWEGFSLVATEAMACLLPVVATDCGGIVENLDGFGRLVPVRNSARLTEAILEELDTTWERGGAELERARLHAMRRFSIDAIARQWIETYRELGKKRGLNMD